MRRPIIRPVTKRMPRPPMKKAAVTDSIVARPVHELLRAFVGRWSITGTNLGGAPVAANSEVRGEESYEWLPGEFFLVGRWDRRFGDQRHVGVSVMGRGVQDPPHQAHHFDNLGDARTYALSASGRTLTFSGEQERAKYEIAEDGRTFRARWEIFKGVSRWAPLCELVATRIGTATVS